MLLLSIIVEDCSLNFPEPPGMELSELPNHVLSGGTKVYFVFIALSGDFHLNEAP